MLHNISPEHVLPGSQVKALDSLNIGGKGVDNGMDFRQHRGQ